MSLVAQHYYTKNVGKVERISMGKTKQFPQRFWREFCADYFFDNQREKTPFVLTEQKKHGIFLLNYSKLRLPDAGEKEVFVCRDVERPSNLKSTVERR